MVDSLATFPPVVELTGQGKDEDTKMLRVETIGAIVYSGLKNMFTLAVSGKRTTHVGMKLLAQAGQTPDVMIVSFCDSRVDPETIFSGMPGELFVVRNVANLVPPFETGGRK